MTGIVSEVKTMAVHDGDGLRTTLFLKGCPLRCVWCHNPESLSVRPCIRYIASKCVSCGACASSCPAHEMSGGMHVFRRELCTACGKCVPLCPKGAMIKNGAGMTAREAAELLLRDRVFYEVSGGGVTLSGGEPLMQSAFAAEVLAIMKSEGINTAVDTCGFAPREAVDEVMPFTDTFLFDVKAADAGVHARCTGRDNAIILDNLRYICASGKRVEIRVPFIPGYNDGEIPAIAALLKPLPGISLIRLLPYHSLAQSKYESLGMPFTEIKKPQRNELSAAASILEGTGVNVIIG